MSAYGAVNVAATFHTQAGYLIADETGEGRFRTTRIRFADLIVTMADDAGVTAYGGLKVYDMPEGVIEVLGSRANLTRVERTVAVDTGFAAAFDGDASVGTVTAGTGASLSSTEANLVPSFSTAQASAGVSAGGNSVATTRAGTIDGTSSPMDIFLNLLVDDADQDLTTTASNLAVTGEIELSWMIVGDK